MSLEAIRYSKQIPEDPGIFEPALSARPDPNRHGLPSCVRRLEILNQLVLPLKTEYLPISSVQDGWDAIKTMKVRGAPAIAIVGCLSLAVELDGLMLETVEEVVRHVEQSLDHLVDARPTAVNMLTAAKQFKLLARNLLQQHVALMSGGDATGTEAAAAETIKERLIVEMEGMLCKDVADNIALGDFGAKEMLERCRGKDKLTILTHCNTGSLATAGYGTALGVIRSLQKLGKLEHVYFNETRPYNQGSRLTAYELITEQIPSTLICDSAAAWLMASGKVDCVVTGADRVAANGTVSFHFVTPSNVTVTDRYPSAGDSANKIGTYMLGVLCQYHNIPFYIAAPSTTCDMHLDSGRDIIIEERDSREITHFREVQISPDGIECWNPAFDVTPAPLITGGIVTEKGVFHPDKLKQALSDRL